MYDLIGIACMFAIGLNFLGMVSDKGLDIPEMTVRLFVMRVVTFLALLAALISTFIIGRTP